MRENCIFTIQKISWKDLQYFHHHLISRFFCLKYLLLRALPSDGLKYSSSMGSRSTISGLEEGSSETFMVTAVMKELWKKRKKKRSRRQVFVLFFFYKMYLLWNDLPNSKNAKARERERCLWFHNIFEGKRVFLRN